MINVYRAGLSLIGFCLTVLPLVASPVFDTYAPQHRPLPNYGAGHGHAGPDSSAVSDTGKPALRSIRASADRFCIGQSWQATYEMSGRFDSTNRFVFYLINFLTSEKLKISETRSLTGTVQTTIATSLPLGNYGIQIESTGPALTFRPDLSLDVKEPPRATLSGQASIYAGQTANLSTVTSGSLPITLTLSDGTTQQLNASSSFLTVSPSQTTSYSLVGVQNSCGSGSASGQATVSVIPNTGRTITPTLASSPSLCAGTKLAVFVDISGMFDSTNVFTVQLSDSTGGNFRNVVTEGGSSPFTITLPPDLPPASGYRYRVMASTPATEGVVSRYPIRILTGPAGRLTGSKTLYKGDSTQLTVALTGAAPWYFSVGNATQNHDYVAYQSPHIVTVKPDTTTQYRLLRISNRVCSTGLVSGTAIVTVALITASEPVVPITVTVYPNPTRDRLLIEGQLNHLQPVQLRLMNLSGQTLHEHATRQPVSALSHSIDLSAYPTGIYLLSVMGDGQKAVYRVMKQ